MLPPALVIKYVMTKPNLREFMVNRRLLRISMFLLNEFLSLLHHTHHSIACHACYYVNSQLLSFTSQASYSDTPVLSAIHREVYCHALTFESIRSRMHCSKAFSHIVGRHESVSDSCLRQGLQFHCQSILLTLTLASCLVTDIQSMVWLAS